MVQEPTLRRPVSWTTSRLQTELAAELRALLARTGGLRQQTGEAFTTRRPMFAPGRRASSCQTLDLAGGLPQHLADLRTVSRHVLGLRIGGLTEINRYEFLTIEPVQPFSALAHQGRDACEGNPQVGTRLRR